MPIKKQNTKKHLVESCIAKRSRSNIPQSSSPIINDRSDNSTFHSFASAITLIKSESIKSMLNLLIKKLSEYEEVNSRLEQKIIALVENSYSCQCNKKDGIITPINQTTSETSATYFGDLSHINNTEIEIENQDININLIQKQISSLKITTKNLQREKNQRDQLKLSNHIFITGFQNLNNNKSILKQILVKLAEFHNFAYNEHAELIDVYQVKINSTSYPIIAKFYSSNYKCNLFKQRHPPVLTTQLDSTLNLNT